MATYIPSLITLFGTVLSALISLVIALVTSRRANDKTLAIMEERIKNLTEEVKKHNNIIERTYKLEQAVAVIEARFESKENK